MSDRFDVVFYSLWNNGIIVEPVGAEKAHVLCNILLRPVLGALHARRPGMPDDRYGQGKYTA